MQETRVRFLGREDPLEKEMATHSSTLAWKIPWSEKPGRLQSMGSQRVGHDWATSLHFTSLIDNISNEKLTLIPTVPSPHLHSLLKPVALNLRVHQNYLEGCWVQPLECLIQEVWDKACKSVFLTNSQVALTWLIQGSPFESCYSRHSLLAFLSLHPARHTGSCLQSIDSLFCSDCPQREKGYWC